MELQLSKLYDNFKKFLSDLNIVYDVDKIYNNEHKNRIIESMLRNINKKKTLEIIPNALFSGSLQFNNIAGFEAVDNNGGQLHSPYIEPKKPKVFKTLYKNDENEMKEKWHYDMLKIIEKIFHDSNSDTIITSMNEEWHNYLVNGPNDEFVTLVKNSSEVIKPKGKDRINFLGKILKPISKFDNVCDENEVSNIISHRIFHINNNIILVNIHTSSNMVGHKMVNEIFKLLKKIKKQYKNHIVILGGDSNIYYGKINKNNDGVSDINYLSKLLSKINYNLLISKHIVSKYRPYNFFQNAQSATKGGDWTNEETMIISYPKNLKIKYDKKRYLLLTNGELKITDFYKKYTYGFSGIKYKNMNRKEHFKSINEKNWFKNIFSDHMPIYCNLEIDNLDYRLIFTNNLGITSNRGVNNNVNLFKIKDNKILEKLSNNQVVDFFIKEIEIILGKKSINKESKIKYLKELCKTEIKFNLKKTKKKTIKKNDKNKSLFKKYWNSKNNCHNYKNSNI